MLGQSFSSFASTTEASRLHMCLRRVRRKIEEEHGEEEIGLGYQRHDGELSVLPGLYRAFSLKVNYAQQPVNAMLHVTEA